ncbi:tachykinin-4 [Tupaia chinensis]|uniref:tachykinin-4 n=1 Tax=Tupaia chinensis TaxID=246437 RepID=UPI0003C9180E|nr:tachykinin-4 [Tupaia chinensis]
MRPCLTLLLLMGLSVCTAAGDSGEKLALSTDAEPWVTVTLEEGAVASVQLQLQGAKRSKPSQFFGLMGKQIEGIPPIQPGRTGYQQGQPAQSFLGSKGPSIEELSPGREEEDRGAE